MVYVIVAVLAAGVGAVVGRWAARRTMRAARDAGRPAPWEYRAEGMEW